MSTPGVTLTLQCLDAALSSDDITSIESFLFFLFAFFTVLEFRGDLGGVTEGGLCWRTVESD